MPVNSSSVKLEARVAQLEALVCDQQQRLRRHRAFGVAAVLLVGAGVMTAAVAQQAAPTVTQTQRLEIVSEDGNLLMAAGPGAHGGRLEIFDNEGDVLLTSYAAAEGGRVDVCNREGLNVLRAASNEFGGDLAVWNAEGRNVAGTYATSRGASTALWASDGQPTFKATTSEDAPGGALTVFGAAGTRSFAASAADDGCGQLHVYNNADEAVFSVDGQLDMGCVMALSNNVGTRLFMIGTRAGGGVLNAMNDRGEVMGMFGVDEGGFGAITLRNQSGMKVVEAGADENRDGIIKVFDAANANMRTVRP